MIRLRLATAALLTLIARDALAVAPAGGFAALMQNADAEFDLGHGRVAIGLYQQAADAARRVGDERGEMLALDNVGTTFKVMREPQQAIAPLAKALEMARQIGDATIEADALNKLGEAAFDAGDLAHTMSAYRDLLAQAEAAHNTEAAAVAAERLGRAQLNSGAAKDAIAPLRRAVALNETLSQVAPEMSALITLGSALDQAQQYLDAAAAYRRCADLAGQLYQKADESRALSGLGNALYHLGNYSGAVAAHKTAVALAGAAGDRLLQSRALINLGNAQGFLGQWQDAATTYRKALNGAHDADDRALEAQAAGNLGLAYRNLRDYAQAEPYLRQDVEIAHELHEDLVEAQALDNLGGMLSEQGRHRDAIPLLERSRDLAAQLGASRSEAATLRVLGIAQLQTGNPAAAETSLRRAVEIRQTLRAQAAHADRYNISLLDTGREDTIRLQAVLVAENKPAEALAASEAGRARALADKLAASAGEAVPAPALSVQELGAVAAAHAVTFVEYAVLDEVNQLLIWVVQPDGRVAFRPVKGNGGSIGPALASFVHDSRATLGAEGPQNVPAPSPGIAGRDQMLTMMHQLLIAPVADLLPASPDAPVVLIPDGDMFKLPFAALLDPSGHPLIESHTLAIAPSIQTFAQVAGRAAGTRHEPGDGAFVAGDPVLGPIKLDPQSPPQQFQPLAQARREVSAVAALLHATPLTGAAATRQAAIAGMPAAEKIHLATHGVPQDVHGDGFPGALLLAGGPGDDGMLTAMDVAALQLRADLVVLSACDTGLGTISGDGVIGLSRAFLGAGARSVVVSLWTVPDQATSELMQAFYAALARGRSKPQALRQAMLDTRAHHPDPVEWAGFVLVGDSQ